MGLNIQPVTVAIADRDHDRRSEYERILEDEIGITLLTNVKSNNEVGSDLAFVNRRLRPRINVTASEDEVARIKRLKPLVVLVNLNLCTDDDYAFLLSLHRECPDPFVILLADDSIDVSRILQALEIGARGYLTYETAQLHLSMAIRVVGHGEAWIPRKMLGNIMTHMLKLQSFHVLRQ